MSRLTELIAIPATLHRDHPRDLVLEGIVVAGSWDASTATCQVVIGDTYSAPSDSGDQPDIEQVTVAVGQIGDQYGPVGGERVTLLRTQSGWIALFEHGDDDSQQVPSGERWISHVNAQGVVDAYLRHTNDGPTTGDGLGGAHYGGNAALAKTTTKGGHVLSFNDTTKQAILESAGGHTITLDDAAKLLTILATFTGNGNVVKTIYDPSGNAISHVCPTGLVALGDLASNLSTVQNAAQRYSDMVTFAKSIRQMVGNALQQVISAAETAGVTNATAWMTTVLAGLPSLSFTDLTGSIASLDAPAGSTNVLIK